MNEKLQNNII